jgi:hypothetical protein
MKKQVKINGRTWFIPQDWNDVTIANQIEANTLAEIEENNVLALLAGYSSIPLEELKIAKFDEVKEILASMQFIKEPVPESNPQEFDFNDKHYVLQEDIFDMRTEDVISILTASENHKDNPIEVYPIILAVIYRSEEEQRLSDFNLDKKAAEFRDLPLPIGVSAYGFFLSVGNVQEILSLMSSPEVLKQLLQEKLKDCKSSLNKSVQDGRGRWYTKFQIGLMTKYLSYLEKNLDTLCSTTASEPTTKNSWQTFKRFVSRKKKENTK